MTSTSPRPSTAAPTTRATAGPSRRPPGRLTGRRSRRPSRSAAAGGTVLTIKLHHKFQNTWTLGRFRLSVTRSVKPVGPSLPEDFRAILAVAPEVRTEAQKNVLLTYFRAIDPELRGKTAAVAASKAPLPVDPKLKELRDQLEYAKKPVQPDPVLVALRRDVEISVEQAATRRLTAAQDIAWALINSPAFLFNH